MNELADSSSAVRAEDRVEDVFVGYVNSTWGGFHLFWGVIADPDYWIEELLSSVDEQTPFGATRGEILALLRLSEALADRLALQRYTPGSGNRATKIQVPRWTKPLRCHEALRFSNTDLANLEIERASLGMFCLTSEMRRYVAHALLWNRAVDEHPIIGDESAITIVAPSCIGRAVLRRLVATVAVEMRGWANMFSRPKGRQPLNKVLHRLDTSLHGRRIRAASSPLNVNDCRLR